MWDSCKLENHGKYFLTLLPQHRKLKKISTQIGLRCSEVHWDHIMHLLSDTIKVGGRKHPVYILNKMNDNIIYVHLYIYAREMPTRGDIAL